jgi:hypothetical protein
MGVLRARENNTERKWLGLKTSSFSDKRAAARDV